MSTLIAEELLLLLLDDELGTVAASDKIQPLLGGALLIELTLAQRIEVTERTSVWRQSLVAVHDGPPFDEPLLDRAVGSIGENPRSAQDLVNRLGKGTKDVLLQRLADRGLIHPVKGKVFGIFPHTTWPASDRVHETAVRERLQGALVGGLTPDERTSALISLLAAVDHAHKVVDCGDLPVREVKRRAKDITDGAWAAKAVKDAVAAAQAAMVAAVVASTAVATAGGS